ncbi:unnamed protein product [Paramecium pentaurelia]|uniref:Uncharacterized protein n=1 Tax=Paramecium pentaurelia TaxID=43138 RepID=A0A8S1SL36_9CILI|nr:unnamed protein product [Paramecium pentaurelia]
MGNYCSDQQQMNDKTKLDQINSKSNLKGIPKPKLNSLINTSQLTQMEIPNAMLQSPTKPFIPNHNEIKSLVRVPSEDSLFLSQFNMLKDSEIESKSICQQKNKQQPLIELKSSLKCKKKQNHAQNSKIQSQSPYAKQQIKCHSHSPIYSSAKVEIKTKKSKNHSKQVYKQQELKPKRKYSDAPVQKEKQKLIRRKISDIRDDHNFIIGIECYSPTKLRTYTPTSILKRKDSDIESNSPLKKQVRFKEDGINRKIHHI